MNKKKCLYLVVAILLTLSLSPMVDYAQSASKPVVLRLAEHSPAMGMRADGLKVFRENLQKKTDGRVKLEIYYGGSLLKKSESLSGCAQGVADMQFTDPVKLPKELPHWMVFASLPQGLDHPRKEVNLFYRGMKEIPELEEDYAKWNQKPIGFHSVPWRTLFTTKPVTSPWDMKGLTIRVNGKRDSAMMGAINVRGVFMQMSECYMALQTRTIDGVYTAVESGYRFKLHEVSKSAVIFKSLWNGGAPVLSINLDSLKKLSPGDQKTLLDAAKDLSYYYCDLLDDRLGKIIADMENMGFNVIFVSTADQAKWASLPKVANLSDEWAKSIGRPDILKRVKELIAEEAK